MNNNGTPSTSDNKVDKDRGAGGGVSRSLVALSVFLALAAIGLGIWGYTEHVRASLLSIPTASPTAAPTTTSTPIPTPAPTDNLSGWSIADLSAFESAFESGNYEKVRALFTDDGVLTTLSNAHYAFYNGEVLEGVDTRVGGKEFRRLASLHGGSNFTILGTPIQVGDNTVAFGWQWSTPGSAFFLNGTAILHLRQDGKIVIAMLNPSQVRIGE